MDTTRGLNPRRSRWQWALTLLLGVVGIVGGIVGAVIRSRRSAPTADRFATLPAEQLTWPYREAATGRSPIGNGVVRTHHRRGEDG